MDKLSHASDLDQCSAQGWDVMLSTVVVLVFSFRAGLRIKAEPLRELASVLACTRAERM